MKSREEMLNMMRMLAIEESQNNEIDNFNEILALKDKYVEIYGTDRNLFNFRSNYLDERHKRLHNNAKLQLQQRS